MKNLPLGCSSLRRRDMVWAGIFTLLMFGGCDRKASDPHFVGHVVALTGPDRDRGLAASRGVQLAVEAVNADQNRWVAGRKVAVIHADSESKLDTAGKQAVRLAAVNRTPSLLGGLTRPESDVLAKVAREYGMMLVGASGTTGSPAVPEAFALGISPGRRARIIDQFLAETLKPSKIALIVDENLQSTGGFVDALSRLLNDRKAAFAVMTFRKPEEFGALALNWGTTLPTVVFVGSSENANRLRGITDPPAPLIFGGDEVDAHQLVNGANDESGPYWVGAYAREALSAEFANIYVERFQAFPPIEAMMGYDSARVLFSAAQEVRSFTAPKLVIRFKQNKAFEGLMGPIVFGTDQVGGGPAFVLQATKTGPSLRKRIEAEGADNKK